MFDYYYNISVFAAVAYAHTMDALETFLAQMKLSSLLTFAHFSMSESIHKYWVNSGDAAQIFCRRKS